jgi:hypothetical protein
MVGTEQYAHVLLFACPRCNRPLSSTCVSSNKNLEIAEAKWFTPHCHCGWSGDVAGITAVQHWVERWHRGLPINAGEPGSCEEQSLKK